MIRGALFNRLFLSYVNHMGISSIKSTYRPKLSDRIIITALVVSYAFFVINTIFDNTYVIQLFSPMTAALCGILILACLKRLGEFWLPAFILSLGIFSWMTADILTFINTWYTDIPVIDTIITYIFLLPNYFFGASVFIYFSRKIKGRELYQFLTNTLILSVIGLVVFKKILEHLDSFNTLQDLDLIRIYLYFFINLFIIIMLGHMTCMIAAKSGLKGTNMMIVGIGVYILLDIPYTYQQAVGNDPENTWQNLAYMFCMMLMSYGIFHQISHRHVFEFKSYEYSEKSARRSRLLVLTGILVSVVLFAVGFFSQYDFFYMLIALMAYWIITGTLRNDVLNEQLIKQQDMLTGLYNRRYCNTLLEESAMKAKETKTKFALYCIDLNSFKPINDTYGHDMGDNVLKEFGSRMKALPSDYISFRTGGDEFMIVKRDIKKDQEIKETAKKLQQLFNTPVNIGSYVFRLSGSIGVAVYPTDTENIDTLMLYSDAAMYSVKHSNNKYAYKIFDRSLIETVIRHAALEMRLKNAEPSKDFSLFYQPRINAETGELIGAEVFPRLKGDNSYTAAQLLPVAEEVGLINRLNVWIVETAIRKLYFWNQNYKKDLFISLNLSPLQLLDQNFIEYLQSMTRDLKISPSMIHLEIGNDVIMGASDTAKDTLKLLKDKGFKLALNDFGGGDINLRHILDCGFTSILISPSLIRRAYSDTESHILIRSIVALSDSMAIESSAVGIETKEQEESLKAMGIRTLQGFYYGRPQEADAFEKSFLES